MNRRTDGPTYQGVQSRARDLKSFESLNATTFEQQYLTLWKSFFTFDTFNLIADMRAMETANGILKASVSAEVAGNVKVPNHGIYPKAQKRPKQKPDRK